MCWIQSQDPGSRDMLDGGVKICEVKEIDCYQSVDVQVYYYDYSEGDASMYSFISCRFFEYLLEHDETTACV